MTGEDFKIPLHVVFIIACFLMNTVELGNINNINFFCYYFFLAKSLLLPFFLNVLIINLKFQSMLNVITIIIN